MAVQIPIDRKVLADYCRRHHVQRLALFGSVLRDDFAAASDVDVLVEFEPGHVPGLAFFDMERELTGLLPAKSTSIRPASCPATSATRCSPRP